MKIKNIFFAAILVLAGFSCSMEDDAIMNDVEKGIEEATEAYTVSVSYTHLRAHET